MSGSLMKHSGGLNQTVVELGYDQAKYFELVANDVAQTITFNEPARHLHIKNAETTGGSSVFINVTGTATASANDTPGDNIRVRAGCTFTMDFDAFTCVSIITESGETAQVDGLLGFKGTR